MKSRLWIAIAVAIAGGGFGATAHAQDAGQASGGGSLWSLAGEALAQADPFDAPPPAEEPQAPRGQFAMANEGRETIEMTDGIIPHLPLQDAPVRLVLRQLSMISRKNIVASPQVTGTVSADLYDVTFREALDAILKINGFDYIEQGNFIYVYTADQAAKVRQSERQRVVRVFRLNYTKPEDVQALILPALSPDGTFSATPAAISGVATNQVEAGGMDYASGDLMVITDYPENIDEIAGIIREIDVRPQQVLIEATILRAALTEENALGVDFVSLAGIDFNNLNATPTSSAGVGGSLADETFGIIETNFAGNVPLSAGGIAAGLVTNDIAIFLRALEGVTDTTIVANPKLLVLNKQRGEVLVGRRDGYLTTTITETTATQTVEFLETGTHLIIRPFIGQDGYVRLEVHPEDSSGIVIDNLPQQQTTECTSNVLVKDGHTIVISGLFREITTTSRNQVPLLGNIPFAGAAFRNSADRTEREEVIILLTPHIIKQGPDEALSAQLNDEVSRFRLGMRQQLAWWGRSRLAAQHLRWAKQHIAAGDIEKAQWDLDMTLSMSPTMNEALELREQLTGRALWACEPRVSSARWIVERMIANELGIPANEVLPPRRPLNPSDRPRAYQDATGAYEIPTGMVVGHRVEMAPMGFDQLKPTFQTDEVTVEAELPPFELVPSSQPKDIPVDSMSDIE